MQQLLAVSVFIGIFGGLLIDTAQRTIGAPIHYAQAEEPAREILIEARTTWTSDRIEKEIRDTFPEDPDVAVAIAWAESELKKDAYNPERHKGCSGSIGIMQIACVHHRNNPEELKDIKFNLKKAREVYEERGWKAWGSYTDKRYLEYL